MRSMISFGHAQSLRYVPRRSEEEITARTDISEPSPCSRATSRKEREPGVSSCM